MSAPEVLRIGDAIMNARTIPGRVGFFAASRFDPDLVWIVSRWSIFVRPCGMWRPAERREPIVRVGELSEGGSLRAIASLDSYHIEADPEGAAALVHPDAQVSLDLPGLGRICAATTPNKGIVVLRSRDDSPPFQGAAAHAAAVNPQNSLLLRSSRVDCFFVAVIADVARFASWAFAAVATSTWPRTQRVDDCIGLSVAHDSAS